VRHVDRFARMLAIVLLIAAWTDSSAAEFAVPADDGWHVWHVQGATGAANACCYRWRGSNISTQGCDLDGRHGDSISLGDCDIDGDQVSVYVRIDAGRVTRIRALTTNCPVTTRTAVTDMGEVGNNASVAWLLRQVDADSRVADGALAAISAHAGDDAFVALKTLLEDRNRRQKTREQALFWLAQSESERAFDYLDALLSSN